MTTPDARLMREGEFSLEELEENRLGRLHPRQRSRLRPGNFGFVSFLSLGLLFLAGGGAGAYAYYDMVRKPLERLDQNAITAILAGGVVLGLAAIGFSVSVLRDARRKRALIDAGSCIAWDIGFDFTQEQLTFKDYFYVRRGDEQLQIGRQLARVMKPGGKYRVYIAAGSLISLEPLD